MGSYEENIPLSKEDIESIRKILKETPFRDLKINDYFFRSKFSGDISEYRHGVSPEDVEKLYSKPEIIKRGFKRKSKRGYNYTLCYEKTATSFIKVIYLFNNKPIEILSAIKIDRRLEGALKKKYGVRF